MVLVFAVTLGGLWVETRSLFWLAFAALVLLAAVRRYVLPTTFRLDMEGAAVRTWFGERRKSWSAVRSFHRDRNGVLLSPFPGPSRRESFRGVYLLFDGNADAVMAFVRGKLGRDGDVR